MAITITITSKSVIDYTQLQLQLLITPCLDMCDKNINIKFISQYLNIMLQING